MVQAGGGDIYNGAKKKATTYHIDRSGERYPRSVQQFNIVWRNQRFHPTQKPVALFEYLIKTYTDEGGVVLDNCLGSGTTMEACQNLKRSCIGIELSQEYCDIIRKRCFTKTFLDRQVKYDYRGSAKVIK